MIFIKAFIICGIICCISQIIIMNTKLGFQGIMVVLMAAGAILGITGLFEPLAGFGFMGMIITLAAFCTSVYGSFLAVLTTGDFVGLITSIIMVVVIFIIGIFCGVAGKLPPVEK